MKGKLDNEKIQHLKRCGISISPVKQKRPLRRFADWWDTTPCERFLEDIAFVLQQAAIFDVVNLVASITIILSLFSWWSGRQEQQENEHFATWRVIHEAAQDQSGVASVSAERLNRNGFSLAGLNLKKTELRGVNLQAANLVDAKLQNAVLSEADLRDANLWKANLSGVILKETNFQRANLREVNFQEAVLLGTNFKDATYLTLDQFEGNNSPFVCHVVLPDTIQGLRLDRDCDKLPKLLNDRFGLTQEETQNIIEDVRKKLENE